MSVTAVILSGGEGSRLWPVSRAMHPKPFIRLHDGQSLIQKTFLRATHLPEIQDILTVTNREFFFKTEDEYAAVNETSIPMSYLLEPMGRNTAPAILAAALQIEKKQGRDAVMLVLTADHLIADEVAFQTAVKKAIVLAVSGKLVTFGIQPHAPETGFGYIEAEGERVLRFVEKPPLAQAQAYVASGRYYWNSGMFCFTVGALLDAFLQHAPTILQATEIAITQSVEKNKMGAMQLLLQEAAFSRVPSESIDYALMEKSNNVAVVPCDIGWHDIGCWRALGDLTPADLNHNRLQGDVFIQESTHCTVQTENRLVGLVGVENLVVIDTPDALLIANKQQTQAVKQLYSQLKEKNHDVHRLHQTIHRPWGSFTVLENSAGFKIKRIVVKPGAQLSLQMHHHRSEHWVVISGVASVTNGQQLLQLKANESTFIPAMHQHRLENKETIPLVIIEVQTGEYLGEDDIVRFDDVYGRVEVVV